MLNQAEAVLGGEHAEVQPEDLLLTARSISTSRLYDLVMQATAHAKTRQNSQTSGGLKKFMVCVHLIGPHNGVPLSTAAFT